MLKRSLSQNLIKDKNLLRKLIQIANVGIVDEVVEVGAGQGDLTAILCEHAGKVHAIELDRAFIPYLDDLGKRFNNLDVLHGDFLKVDLAELAAGRVVRVIGNIPYGITGPILFKLIDQKMFVADAYLTVQREVAERLVSPSHRKSYGSLSVVFQTLAEVTLHLVLNPRVFVPPPKVQSAFIGIRFRDAGLPADSGFPQFARGCFAHKRKQLRRILESRWDSDVVEALYRHMGFAPTVRAEEIEPEQFVEMYGVLKGTGKVADNG
jgi:16S rRNA (adenine1518-N6/adenine1519-N6)-dimethyltransferase